MAMKHSVYDTDTHFSVNPVTRVLKNESLTKTGVIQFDHNSERFTFEIPRVIEGHDMSLCDVIQVHYNNIDSQTKEQSKGVYEVDDMQISPDDDSIVILSWLISSNATKYVGSLNFLIRFGCTGDEDGHLSYVWNTAIYTGISVSTGINNGEAVVYEYADILEQWRQELEDIINSGGSGGVSEATVDKKIATAKSELIGNADDLTDADTIHATKNLARGLVNVLELRSDEKYVAETELASAVESALATAKASGEFDGAKGTSVTVYSVSESTADGGSNVVTFSDGKTLTVKNGSKGSRGDTGADGAAGADGTSVTVSSVSESTADGGSNVVTFSDGKTLTVKNGSKGLKGDSYVLTEDDKAEIIEEATEILNNGNVPDYWQTELSTKADTIQQAIETAGRNKSAFLWYTDAHWQTNSKMSPILLKYLCKNTPINKVNFGGDIINDPSEFTHANIKYAYQWRNMIADLPNHHSVYGNHDVNHRTGDVANMAYSIILADEESAEMVVGGDSYYYIDSPSEKTRYLYLSYLTNNQAEMLAQGEFIVEAIKGVDEGWHIVVIAHRWFQYSSSSAPTVGSVPSFEQDILNVFDEYNARTTHSASNYFYAQDFTDCKGKVEFCIGGHIHVDYDFTTTGGIPVIITASDTNQERSGDETEDCGTVGTITESAVYGIVADYTNNKITVVGVGRGGSRVIGGTEEPDEPVPEARLFNLDRTYVSGTEGEKIADHLDENKAYLNVPYTSDSAFYAKSCTATGISENSVTVKESGDGGVCVAYPIHLTDIETQSYKIAFDYSGAGKCRTYFKYATANGELSSVNTLLVNDTAGASDSAEITIPAVSGYGYEWVIIYFSSNTGNTKTFTNVSMTKAN